MEADGRCKLEVITNGLTSSPSLAHICVLTVWLAANMVSTPVGTSICAAFFLLGCLYLYHSVRHVQSPAKRLLAVVPLLVIAETLSFIFDVEDQVSSNLKEFWKSHPTSSLSPL